MFIFVVITLNIRSLSNCQVYIISSYNYHVVQWKYSHCLRKCLFFFNPHLSMTVYLLWPGYHHSHLHFHEFALYGQVGSCSGFSYKPDILYKRVSFRFICSVVNNGISFFFRLRLSHFSLFTQVLLLILFYLTQLCYVLLISEWDNKYEMQIIFYSIIGGWIIR